MEMFMGINNTGIQRFCLKYDVWKTCCRHDNNMEALIAVQYDILGKCVTALRLQRQRILNTFRYDNFARHKSNGRWGSLPVKGMSDFIQFPIRDGR